MTSRIPFALAAFVCVLSGEVQPQAAELNEPPTDPWEWQRAEVARFFRGVQKVQLEGWGPLNAKVLGVAKKLVDYSGMVFPVVPAQTFTIGQAHAGGWILLDLSTAMRPKDELAFWLAHEWGHEALGHQPNFYRPVGEPWRSRETPTADEDAADFYAGGFICKGRYDIAKVIASLRKLPHAHGDTAHSDGRKRARTALAGYEDRGCTPPTDVEPLDNGATDLGSDDQIEEPSRTTTTIPCEHAAHPDGDRVACQHAAHPADLIDCQHACPGPFGWVACHAADQVPCSHAAHPFHLVPCEHAKHPGGDTVDASG